ncbi:MAG: hypothetical protein Q9204_007980 [Flavoplaca sp. TL-2023a]
MNIVTAPRHSPPIQPISRITASSSQASPLLRLPAEVRLMIYNHLFDCELEMVVCREDFMRGKLANHGPWNEDTYHGWVCHVGILTTCRLIRAEAMKLFLQKCRFVFVMQPGHGWWCYDGTAPKTKSLNTDFIRKVSLTASTESVRNGCGIFDFAFARDDLIYLRLLEQCAMLFPGLSELTYLYDMVIEPTFAMMKEKRVKLCVSEKMAWDEAPEALMRFCEKVDVRIEVRKVVDWHGFRNVVGYSGPWISQSLGRGMELVNFVPLHE